MVKKKTKSKRRTIKMRVKIQKKVREHHRKARKEAKKALLDGVRQVKKDPGIPNLWPFKEKVLKEIQHQKERELERKQLLKDQNKVEVADIQSTPIDNIPDRIASLQNNFQEADDKSDLSNVYGREHFAGESNRKAFLNQLMKVINQSDIILQVLDARDPLGCRSKWLEDKILQTDPNKKIILILNKIDLVPRDIVIKWLSILRKDFPTIAFRASIQHGKKLSQLRRKAETLPLDSMKSAKALGSDTLLQLVKNYSRSDDMKTALTVGVIGYPNVGKSSIINSLCRKYTAGVSSAPNFTKTIQEIYVDKKIKVLDCAGIIYHDDPNDTNVLRNCIGLNSIDDPEEVVTKVLGKLNPEYILKYYNIPVYRNSDEFLFIMAKKRGKIVAGGVPNKKAAAKSVLKDWNSGKLPFYVSPPPDIQDITETQLISEFGDDMILTDMGETKQNYLVIESVPSANYQNQTIKLEEEEL